MEKRKGGRTQPLYFTPGLEGPRIFCLWMSQEFLPWAISSEIQGITSNLFQWWLLRPTPKELGQNWRYSQEYLGSLPFGLYWCRLKNQQWNMVRSHPLNLPMFAAIQHSSEAKGLHSHYYSWHIALYFHSVNVKLFMMWGNHCLAFKWCSPCHP